MKNVIDWEVLLCCWTIRQVNAESYERASFCVHCGLQSGLKGKEHTHKWGGGNYNIHGGGCASSRGGEGVSCLLVA